MLKWRRGLAVRVRLEPLNWPLCIDRVGLQFSVRQQSNRPDAPAVVNPAHRCSDGNAFNPSQALAWPTLPLQRSRVSIACSAARRCVSQSVLGPSARASRATFLPHSAQPPKQSAAEPIPNPCSSARSSGGRSIVVQLSAAALATPTLTAASGCYARIAAPP